MEKLILRLGADAQTPIDWAIWQTTERTIIASGVLPDADALASLQERAAGRPVTVLVPSTEVLLKRVDLPPGASRKVIQSIGFMLEDDVATDIDEQFIALGPKQGDQQAVAIVAHNTMRQWLGWLTAANLHCDIMLPEVLALPLAPFNTVEEDEEPAATASIITIRDQVILRDSAWSGFCGENDWVIPVISAYFNAQSALISLTQYTTDDAFSSHQKVQTVTAELELPMHILADGIATHSLNFNLCQGQYQQRKRSSGQWQYWRSVAAVAIIALTLGLIDKGLTISQLAAQNETLSTQIKADIQSGFPNIGTYRDARRAITQYVKRIDNMGSGSSAVDMLANLTSAFANSEIKAQSLKFNDDRSELRIQAQAKAFSDLETFKQQAQAAGYTVEDGAINNRNNLVIGTLTIKG